MQRARSACAAMRQSKAAAREDGIAIDAIHDIKELELPRSGWRKHESASPPSDGLYQTCTHQLLKHLRRESFRRSSGFSDSLHRGMMAIIGDSSYLHTGPDRVFAGFGEHCNSAQGLTNRFGARIWHSWQSQQLTKALLIQSKATQPNRSLQVRFGVTQACPFAKAVRSFQGSSCVMKRTGASA